MTSTMVLKPKKMGVYRLCSCRNIFKLVCLIGPKPGLGLVFLLVRLISSTLSESCLYLVQFNTNRAWFGRLSTET